MPTISVSPRPIKKRRTNCVICGNPLIYRHYYCDPCSRQVVLARGRAAAVVLKAKLTGELPELDGTIQCVDCGNPASEYDHRDYSFPLKVDPVCSSCNKYRGPATISGGRQ